MAVNNNSTKFGSYICKVGGILDIYQKTTYEANKALGKAAQKTLKIKNRELAIYHAKKSLAGGFKNKDEAIKMAEEILAGGMEKIKSLKGKK